MRECSRSRSSGAARGGAAVVAPKTFVQSLESPRPLRREECRKPSRLFVAEVEALTPRPDLGIGFNGLMALVRRGVIHTNQVTDFAPWRIARAELDSEPVRALVEILEATGKLPPRGGSPQNQRQLFADKSTNPRKGAL